MKTLQRKIEMNLKFEASFPDTVFGDTQKFSQVDIPLIKLNFSFSTIPF